MHDLFEPSTGVWQYIVADPHSRRCVVIDPVLNHNPKQDGICTLAADAILTMIRESEYLVDQLLDTRCFTGQHTAVWYLRMQLQELQGYAPRVRGSDVASSTARIFEQKYGIRSGFTTTLDKEMNDGDTSSVGHMQIVAIHLPGPTKDHFGYLIGENLFGAHAIAHLLHLVNNDLHSLSSTSVHLLTTSMQKILSFPETYRVHSSYGNELSNGGVAFATVADYRTLRHKVP